MNSSFFLVSVLVAKYTTGYTVDHLPTASISAEQSISAISESPLKFPSALEESQSIAQISARPLFIEGRSAPKPTVEEQVETPAPATSSIHKDTPSRLGHLRQNAIVNRRLGLLLGLLGLLPVVGCADKETNRTIKQKFLIL